MIVHTLGKKIYKTKQIHPFHLVDPSPWPLLAAVGAFALVVGGVSYMHNYQNGGLLLLGALFYVIFVSSVWWRDIVREATYEGQHTKKVQSGLRMGMVLFIISEIMFFFAFFWAFFHSSLAPGLEIGGVWPPKGQDVISPWKLPLLNTALLLTSGATITWAHENMLNGNRKEALNSLFYTIVYALFFTAFQIYEYFHAPFGISDSVYGSVFFMATGFHGFHVFIGTCFLCVCLLRLYQYHFTVEHHFGFEAAAWYWHFVDVVWLFLFVSVYWWGG